MLPDDPKDDPNDARGKREDYLGLPYNHPTRQVTRWMEAYHGKRFREINEREASSGGFFAGALAVAGAVGGFVLLGPGGVTAGALLGGGVGSVADLFVKMRRPIQAEWDIAERVFRGTLGSREDVLITNISGASGREFVIPGSALATLGSLLNPALFTWLIKNQGLFAGKVLVNLGSGFDDPIAFISARYPRPGQIWIHELTHVWQIRHRTFSIGWVCDGAVTQLGNSLGGDAYGVPRSPDKPWSRYGIEQQAAIVDLWYQGDPRTRRGEVESYCDPYYGYIVHNVRAGNPDAVWSPPPAVGPAMKGGIKIPIPPAISPASSVVNARKKGPRLG
jgi:hypothetical protein